MIYLTTGLLLVFSISAILLSDTLLSVLSLASASIMLAVIFFQLGAPVAGVFELSVGAGLITVLIVLTIGFIQAKKEYVNKNSIIWVLFSFLVIAILALIFQTLSPSVFVSSIVQEKWQEVGKIFWKLRAFDLLPQALVILACAFGIIALLRSDKGTSK